MNVLYTKSTINVIKLYLKVIQEKYDLFPELRKLNEIIEASHHR